MAYDETLAKRIEAALAEQEQVAIKKMFGGLCFMISGHMCCGIVGAMTHLQERGIAINPAHQSKVVGNLLAIICGDAKVQPTYAVQDYESDTTAENLQKMVELLDEIKAQLAGKS